MTLDAELLRLAWMIGWPILTVVGTWIVARGKATRAEIDGLADRIDLTARRVEKIETEWAHLPTKEQMHKVELQLTEVSGQSKTTAETMKSMQATMSRVESYLLNRNAA